MIVVLGAAGKTGRAVTAALTSRGVPVRAALRPGSASAPYAHALVSATEVDLATGAGLAAALEGADGLFHLAPNVDAREVAMAERTAEAVATQGVPRVVFHSVLHPDDDSMPHHLRKGQAERVLRTAHPGTTVLRPAAYHQNLLPAARAGALVVPYALDAPFTNVDLDDVAEVAATVLLEDGHAGATYELAGPERLTVRELARVAAAVLGHPVSAARLSLPDWLAGPGAALPPGARDDLVAMFRAYDREGFCGEAGTLRRLLGREPASWADLLGRSAAPSEGGA